MIPTHTVLDKLNSSY